ncbi:MAG: phosphopyruvate hydratase [Sulfobacillus acidophilus]|uniref:Enolase n=1 Tax=Sulfobacillus acidophilus TaxID=53633 RepID=A0A2T2WGT0_9FIRM|nr:MAG: phosphopyruvate hydratase [Sulfobacillus acidophilus]
MPINSVHARQILDSRGNPTVEVEVEADGVTGRFQVPSGASTGRFEAVELRDGDRARFAGLGVSRAVGHVNELLGPAIQGWDPEDQEGIDTLLCQIDGTDNKSRLGANAILGISGAVTTVAALRRQVPLYRYVANLFHSTTDFSMPMPMVNMISGGLHAGGQIDVQDYLFVPIGSATYGEAMLHVDAVRRALVEVLIHHGYSAALVADEGGFGPPLASNEEGLSLLTEAIELAGLKPGVSGAIAVDLAASHFYREGRYRWGLGGLDVDGSGMVEVLTHWAERYPLVCLEDGLAEDDWSGWCLLTGRLGQRLQILGDDLFVTNAERISLGIARNAANAVLIKMNQVGTISETLAAVRTAQNSGLRTVVSARSGETEDTFMSDLAVAVGPAQIKVGAIARSERLAKYNRLFRIDDELGSPSLAQPFRPR